MWIKIWFSLKVLFTAGPKAAWWYFTFVGRERVKTDLENDDFLYYDLDDDNCEGCGGVGCPLCLPCGGQYACGSEECDWCPHDQECANHANEL